MRGVFNTAVDFYNQVEFGKSCWIWKGYVGKNGYGRFSFQKRLLLAHRFSYAHCLGPIPAGKQLDHICRNRSCVRPSHLESVTQRENVRRGFGPGGVHFRTTHCPQGHPYNKANTEKRKHGWRGCKACRSVSQKKRYWEQKRAKA